MWVVASGVYVNLAHTAAIKEGVRDRLGPYGQTVPIPTVELYLALPGVKQTVRVRAEGEQAKAILKRLSILAFASRFDDQEYAPRDMYTACE